MANLPVASPTPENSNHVFYEFANIDSKISFAQTLRLVDMNENTFIQSPCKKDNSDIKGIQSAIQYLQNTIEKIKRFNSVNGIIDALMKTVNLEKQLKKF